MAGVGGLPGSLFNEKPLNPLFLCQRFDEAVSQDRLKGTWINVEQKLLIENCQTCISSE